MQITYHSFVGENALSHFCHMKCFKSHENGSDLNLPYVCMYIYIHCNVGAGVSAGSNTKGTCVPTTRFFHLGSRNK